MCPAGAPFDAGYLVIPLVTVGFQISLKAVQKVCCIVSAPRRGISIQQDDRKTIFPGAVQPHEGLAFCTASGFFQHLYPGLICHEKFPQQKLAVKVIIQWPEIMPSTVDDPVRKGCPADSGTILFPVLFLTIERHAVCILLIDCPCNRGRRSRTLANKCGRYFGFDDHRLFRIALSFLTVRAAIAFRVVFINFTFGRSKNEFPADVFFSDTFHRATAYRTDFIFFIQRYYFLMNLETFKKFRMGSFFLPWTWLPAAVFFRKFRILVNFSFIKQIQLSGNISRCLFAGRAEKFFRQIVHLFLKHHLMGSLFLNDRSEGTDQFCLLGHYRIQL